MKTRPISSLSLFENTIPSHHGQIGTEVGEVSVLEEEAEPGEGDAYPQEEEGRGELRKRERLARGPAALARLARAVEPEALHPLWNRKRC